MHTVKKEFLQTPNETAKWKKIADLFHSRWNLPNNLGATDGKRIVIQKAAHAGSHFHDCKGNESIIALVVAGPDYECLFESKLPSNVDSMLSSGCRFVRP